jgi:hypothetical protein
MATKTTTIVATLPSDNAPVHIAFNGSAEAFIATYQGIYKWALDSNSGPWSKWPESAGQRPATGGIATNTVFDLPYALGVDTAGNMLISTLGEGACHVWLVEAQTGKLRLVAGSGVCGNTWDPDPAQIQLDMSYGVAFGPEGRSAVIADYWTPTAS